MNFMPYSMASKRRMSNYFIAFFKLKFNESMLIHLVEVTHDRKCLPEKWHQTQCKHQNRSNSEESDDDEVASQFYTLYGMSIIFVLIENECYAPSHTININFPYCSRSKLISISIGSLIGKMIILQLHD